MTMEALLPELATASVAALVDNAKRLGLVWDLRLATVLDVAGSGIISGLLDGDVATIGLTPIFGTPVAGQRVWVMSVPPAGNYIIGFVGNYGVPLNMAHSTYNNVDTGDPASGTTTSATYVDMPGPMTFTMTKAYESTRVKLFMSGTWFESTGTAGTSAAFGISLSGGYGDVNMSAYRATIPAGIVRLPIIAAERIILNVPAGSTTYTARWFRSTGAGTLGVAIGTDFLSMSAEEIV